MHFILFEKKDEPIFKRKARKITMEPDQRHRCVCVCVCVRVYQCQAVGKASQRCPTEA